MAIQDFNTQMANITRETNMDTARVNDMAGKAGRDTIDQLLGALKSYKEGMQKDKALGLQERDITGNQAYQAGQLGAQREAEFGAEGRAQGARELDWAKMEQDRKIAEMQDKTNQAAIAAKGGKDPDTFNLNKLFMDTVAPGGYINESGMIPAGKWQEFSASVPEDAALRLFDATLEANNVDPKKRNQFREAFRYWYKTGTPPAGLPAASIQPQAKKAMVLNPVAPPPLPFGSTKAEEAEYKRNFPEKAKMTQQMLDELVRQTNMER